MKKETRSNCPLNVGLEVFGDRWSLLIIRDIIFFGKRYYGEFLNSQEGIATNLLADRLRMLEEQGILWKTNDTGHKQKIKYSLTRKGIDLLPVLMEIGLWSDKYFEGLADNREQILGPGRKKEKKGLEDLRQKLIRQHIPFDLQS